MKVVILCGGQGTRFWPASRSSKPKQFLQINGQKSLLQSTYERLHPLIEQNNIFFVCKPQYAEQVIEQIPGITEEQIILEPSGRNTAASIGLSAYYLQKRFGNEVMAVLPADHMIDDRDAFQDALNSAEKIANNNYLVTFGIKPTRAETGYGYIEKGEKIKGCSNHEVFQVSTFREKPDKKEARNFLNSGRFYWNTGIFVWKISMILREIKLYQPKLDSVLHRITASQDWNISKDLFEKLENVSIDYAVMEKSHRVAMIPAGFKWDDLGDWLSMFKHLAGDADGNHGNTTMVAVSSQDCLGYSTSGRTIALLGIDDLVVVDGDDVLLVCHKDRVQEVNNILDVIDPKHL